jgi:hypothetical protein
MFQPLGLGRVAAGAPGRERAAASGRGDEQRHARDDQHCGQIEHGLKTLPQFAFQPLAERGIWFAGIV